MVMNYFSTLLSLFSRRNVASHSLLYWSFHKLHCWEPNVLTFPAKTVPRRAHWKKLSLFSSFILLMRWHFHLNWFCPQTAFSWNRLTWVCPPPITTILTCLCLVITILFPTYSHQLSLLICNPLTRWLLSLVQGKNVTNVLIDWSNL